MDDLFGDAAQPAGSPESPLAARMRPRTLGEFVGQQHLLAPGKMLRRAIEADRFSSMLLYGPPGVGKTSLAQIIAATTRAHFEQLSAVEGSTSDMRRLMAAASARLRNKRIRTVLFVDELHRFNKAQQDVLLPDVESGVIRLIGATTHNPLYYVNGPLVSRSQIFRLEPLSQADLLCLIERALTDTERGLGRYPVRAEPAA